MKHRVALLGIYHESNTFLDQKTRFEDFVQGHLCVGEEIRQEYGEAYHEIGGMLEVLDTSGVEAVPLLFAEATPSGTITAEAYEQLRMVLLDKLKQAGPLDGLLVAAHGAAVSEGYPDTDGHWLGLLREWTESGTPIIATLDPHANLSAAMVEATTALVAYKTNPHVDQRETGKAAGRLMVDTLNGKIHPVQYLVSPPLAISIEQQHTDSFPCRPLYALAEEEAKKEGVLSASIFLGFPYADVPELGSSVLVVADNDRVAAREGADRLSHYLTTHKEDFVGGKISVEEALTQACEADRPILMLDMGDNVGGGSPADSTFLLEALERSGEFISFVCLYDPESVAEAQRGGVGSSVTLRMGGKSDRRHGDPYRAQVRVLQLAEGIFQEREPRHGGQRNFNMGAIALVVTERGTTVMLTSRRTAPFSLQQLTAFGIQPETFDVLVAKGVQAPLAAYAPVCRSVIRVNTPGITPADMTALPFRHRRKPLFPFEPIDHDV